MARSMCAPVPMMCMAAAPFPAPSAIMCDSVVMCDTITKGSSFGGGVVHDITAAPEQPPRDPLLHLVSLQGASGCWLLDPALATALGKTNEEVEKSKPEKANSEVWATILALLWLHGFKMDAKDEWELLAMKAASWLRAQNVPCVTECVDAGNVLLGCSVKKEALGL